MLKGHLICPCACLSAHRNGWQRVYAWNTSARLVIATSSANCTLLIFCRCSHTVENQMMWNTPTTDITTFPALSPTATTPLRPCYFVPSMRASLACSYATHRSRPATQRIGRHSRSEWQPEKRCALTHPNPSPFPPRFILVQILSPSQLLPLLALR